MQESQEMKIWSLGWEDHLEEGMATHSSIFAWKIPRTEEPGRLESMGSHRVRHDWSNWLCLFHWTAKSIATVRAEILVSPPPPTNPSSVQSLSCVRLFVTPWTTAHQSSLSIANSQSPPKPMSIESVMPSSHLITVTPFSSCPQSFPASGSFAVSQLFTSGGQSIRVSASTSVLPMNTQDWSPLGGLVGSSCSPRDSQESSPMPQFKSINSSVLSFIYSPTLTSIHDHWKNHSLD